MISPRHSPLPVQPTPDPTAALETWRNVPFPSRRPPSASCSSCMTTPTEKKEQNQSLRESLNGASPSRILLCRNIERNPTQLFESLSNRKIPITIACWSTWPNTSTHRFCSPFRLGGGHWADLLQLEGLLRISTHWGYWAELLQLEGLFNTHWGYWPELLQLERLFNTHWGYWVELLQLERLFNTHWGYWAELLQLERLFNTHWGYWAELLQLEGLFNTHWRYWVELLQLYRVVQYSPVTLNRVAPTVEVVWSRTGGVSSRRRRWS